MVAALELYFDPHATRRIKVLWQAMEEAGVPSLAGLTHRRHRPHVSLAVAPELDPHKVAAALDGVSVAPPLTLTFDFVGQYLGRVVWLGPAPTAELLALHHTVYGRITEAGIAVSPQYHPGAWVPHCTLSMRVPAPKVPDAIRLCLDVLPIRATVTGAAVADHNRGIYHPLPESRQREP